MILHDGHMVLDKNQTIAEAELVSRLLEDAAAAGPDMTQVKVLAMEWRQPQAWSLALLVMN